MKIEPEDEKEFIKTEYLSGGSHYWIGRQMWPLSNYFCSLQDGRTLYSNVFFFRS